MLLRHGCPAGAPATLCCLSGCGGGFAAPRSTHHGSTCQRFEFHLLPCIFFVLHFVSFGMAASLALLLGDQPAVLRVPPPAAVAKTSAAGGTRTMRSRPPPVHGPTVYALARAGAARRIGSTQGVFPNLSSEASRAEALWRLIDGFYAE